MQKNTLLLLVALFVSSFLIAQSKNSNDEEKIGKYTVKIISNSDKTYGYEIYDNTLLSSSIKFKPYFSVLEGFRIKSNAVIIAKWHVEQLQIGVDRTKIFVEIEKAKKLGVTEEDLKYGN